MSWPTLQEMVADGWTHDLQCNWYTRRRFEGSGPLPRAKSFPRHPVGCDLMFADTLEDRMKDGLPTNRRRKREAAKVRRRWRFRVKRSGLEEIVKRAALKVGMDGVGEGLQKQIDGGRT